MIVTPGIQISSADELITHTKLNLLGTPTVALEQGDIDQILDATQETLGSGVAGKNYFTNPGLDRWTRGTGPVLCGEGVRTRLADDWWVRCVSAISMGSGGTFLPSYSRASITTPQSWLYAAEISGNTGVGAVDFGQEIPARIATGLTPKLTITFDLHNSTGTALTPEVHLDTCSARDNFNTVTSQISQAATVSVANGETKTFTVTLDTTAIAAALRNGALIYIRIPSGHLTSGSAFVRFLGPKLEIGNGTNRYIERDTTPADNAGATGDSAAPAWLRNADFARWISVDTLCAEDVPTYGAEAWAVIPSDGSTLRYQRSTSTPGTEARYSAKLTGDSANTGTVDFVQDISAVAAANLRRPLTYSIYVYNDTGAAFQPTLRLNTCDTENDFAATTNRASGVGSMCAVGTWTRVDLPFDGATATNLANGARLTVRLPAGVLDNSAKVVHFAQAQLNPGGVASDWSVRPVVDVPAVSTVTRNLKIDMAVSAITVTADEAVLIEPGGSGIRIFGLATNGATNGSGLGGLDTGTIAAGMYHLWIISNGQNHGLIVSASATAPVMPAGYRYKARVSGFRVDGSGHATFCQRGQMVFLQPTQVFNATVTTADVYQDILVDSWVPAYAASFGMELRMETSGGNLRCSVASHMGSVWQQDFVAGGIANATNGAYATARVELPVAELPPKFKFKAASNSVTYKLNLMGYRLP